jgi:hypothetical protein
VDREELERLRKDAQRTVDELLPAQPRSDKWTKRGDGLVVRAPLERADIDVLAEAPNLGVLYFERMPPARTWELLNDALFPARPDVWLMVCNWGPPRDDFASLDFLDLLPKLRAFSVSGVRVKHAGALERHPGLVHLDLGGRFSRRFTLDFLSSHPRLCSLGLGGFGFVPRGTERISTLSELESFGAVQGFPTLSFLVPLRKLRSVTLGLGANHDMESLGRVPNLEEVDLGRVRLLEDLSGLGRCRSLRKLTLGELRNVKTIACVGSIPTLEHLWVVALSSLRNLDGVPGHPNLRKLGLFGHRRIPDAELLRLVSCKRLEALHAVIRPAVADKLREALPACRINPT